MANGNPTSGHTNKNLTIPSAGLSAGVTNADGLTDGEHIISPTLTNMIEGIHGNGIIMYDDTSKAEGDRNTPSNTPGAVIWASATTFTVKGGYVVLDGTMYSFAGGPGGTKTYTLVASDDSYTGSGSALSSGYEALVVVYACADSHNDIKNVYWEMGSAIPTATNAYPVCPTGHLKIPVRDSTNLLNTQTIVLAVLRVVYAATGGLNVAITEVNDKRVFIRPSPLYFSPVTTGDIAATATLTDLDTLHNSPSAGAFGASRFGGMWQSFGAQLADTVAGDNAKDVLYYSGTHAARFTRSVFDRVLTSADATLSLTSSDANILILTPTASTNVVTSGTFPAGYTIHIRNKDTDDYVRFALTSSSSSTMVTHYEIAPATFASFVCTTSHASYPTFALLFDDTIDTPQIASNAVTTAKIANDAVTEDKLANALLAEIDANTAKATNVDTDLTATANGTSLTINSSDGDNVALPAATTDAWGVMTDEMFDAIAANTAKATNVDTDLGVTTSTTTITVTSSDGDNAVLPVATTSAGGVMSKAIFDAVTANTAKGTTLTTEAVQDIAGALVASGGTKTGIAVTYDDGNNNMDFVVDHDTASNFVAAEHVDWAGASAGTIHASNYTDTTTNTQLSDAQVRTAVEAATDSNVFTDADHTKLNGIEVSADVTDATNVTAAGALMDSEVTNLAQVKAFNTAAYATAAQGVLAAAAVPAGAGGAEPYNAGAGAGDWIGAPPPDLDTAIQRLAAQVAVLGGPVP